LESFDYTILGKDEWDRVRIKYLLSTIPALRWTKVFNRYNSKIQSIKNSKTIIVTAPIDKIIEKDVAKIVASYIFKTDAEIASEVLKNNILKEMASGFITVHDGLSYFGSNSNYQQYLEKVQEREIVI